MNPYSFQNLPLRLKFPQKGHLLLKRYFPTTFSLPHMTPKEFALFKKHSQKGQKVVEFGSGGSTFFFLGAGKSVYSVESDKAYIEYLQTFPLIKKKAAQKELHLTHADIGETIHWGFPKNESKKDNWPLYYQAIWEDPDFINPDIVFIDGRFRVMCALNSISYISRETVVLVHDFTEREYYSIILEFFDVIDRVDSLIILQLKKKEQIDQVRLAEAKREFQFDNR